MNTTFEQLGYKKKPGSEFWCKETEDGVWIDINENTLKPCVYVGVPIFESELAKLNKAMQVAKGDIAIANITKANAKVVHLKNKGYKIANFHNDITATKYITVDNYKFELVIGLNGRSGEIINHYILPQFETVERDTLPAIDKALNELETTINELKGV